MKQVRSGYTVCEDSSYIDPSLTLHRCTYFELPRGPRGKSLVCRRKG